jgi:hypothetical protein
MNESNSNSPNGNSLSRQREKFRRLLTEIGSYADAFNFICSSLDSTLEGSSDPKSLCICDQLGVLTLVPSDLLSQHLRGVCANALRGGGDDVLVVDLEGERPSLDTFVAVVMAFVAPDTSDGNIFKDPQLRKLQSELRKFEAGLDRITRGELRRYRRGDTHALLLVRGIDSVHNESVGIRASSVKAAAAALGFTNVAFITTATSLDTNRSFWTHVSRDEYAKVISIVLPGLTDPSQGGSSAETGFWRHLQRLFGANGDSSEGAKHIANSTGSIADADAEVKKRALELITLATYPSVSKLLQLAERFRALRLHWSEAARREGEVARALQKKAATHLENSSQQRGGADKIASRVAFLHVVFFTLLELTWPDLIHAANTDPLGWQQFFRLQLMLCRVDSTERLLLGMSNARWDPLLDDSLLRAFYWRAFGVVDPATRLIEPFASAAALRRHFRFMLTDISAGENLSVESWKGTIDNIRRVLEQAEECLEDARAARKRVKDACERFETGLNEFLSKIKEWSSRKEAADKKDEAGRKEGPPVSELLAAVKKLSALKKERETTEEDAVKARGLAETLEVPLEQLVGVIRIAVQLQLQQYEGPKGQQVWSQHELTDAVEVGLRIVGLLELISGPGDSVLRQMEIEPSTELRKSAAVFAAAAKEADAIFEQAALGADDSLAADALIGRARLALAFGPRPLIEADVTDPEARHRKLTRLALDTAARALDQAELRIRDDKLGRLALTIGKALLYEHQGLAPKAATLAREVIRVADDFRARELMARAVSIALRCDFVSHRKPAWRRLARAQVFVDVQAARSPLIVSDLADGRRKEVFISYRTETRSLVAYLAETARGQPDFRLSVWVDYQEIDPGVDDFREAMQLGLDRAGIVLLVLSPGYFRSHWCSYELATTLARRRTAGLRMEWIAASSESVPAAETPVTYAKKLARLATFTVEDQRYLESQIEQVVAQPPLVDAVVKVVPFDVVRVPTALKGERKDVEAGAEQSQYDQIMANFKKRLSSDSRSHGR